MSSESVKLLGAWASVYVFRARIALNIKGLDYEYFEQDLVNKGELLLKSNPVHKKVPVLIHGDKTICESLVIVQYIDEVWASSGPEILPSDPYDRAVARFWAAYIDDKWFPILREILYNDGDEAIKVAFEPAAQGLVLLEDAFTKVSKGGKFFGGDKIGYLDLALGCFLEYVKVIERIGSVGLIDESKTPKLFKWAQDFRAEDAVKDVFPEHEKLYELGKFLRRIKWRGSS